MNDTALRAALAELIRLDDQYLPGPPPHEWMAAWEAARAALASPPAAVPADECDAKRYRWLREMSADPAFTWAWDDSKGGAGFDAAIDAAMSAHQTGDPAK